MSANFITNALGTQADGQVADDGRNSVSSWDAPWQSVARRTDYGWSAEFSIPLSSIRYAAGENRTWGINFGRSRRRSLELSFWSGPLDSLWRVSQAGRLLGLTVPPPLDRLQVVPYGLTRVQEGASPLEGSLDYVATGLPKRGDIIDGRRYLDDASPWSFPVVFVRPVAPM